METTETNSSFFPPPPSRYLQFTTTNLNLAKRIITKLNSSSESFNSKLQKELIEEDCKDLKEEEEIKVSIDLRILIEPPNLDFVKERGGWTCFGDWEPWPGKSSREMLEGMPKLYEEKMERKEALQALLNTLIYSYLKLLNQLSNQGPPSILNLPNQPSQIDQIISHIELTSFNMHGLCNELRPRQAIETLKLMMKEQAREKREKAKLVLKTCEDLKNELIGLKKNHLVGFENQEINKPIRSNLKLYSNSNQEDHHQDFSNENENDWNAILSVVHDF